MNQTTTTTDAPALAGWMQEAAADIHETLGVLGGPEAIEAIIAKHAATMNEKDVEDQVYRLYLEAGIDEKRARDFADRAITIEQRVCTRK